MELALIWSSHSSQHTLNLATFSKRKEYFMSQQSFLGINIVHSRCTISRSCFKYKSSTGGTPEWWPWQPHRAHQRKKFWRTQGTNTGINWSHCSRINSSCLERSWISNLVPFWKANNSINNTPDLWQLLATVPIKFHSILLAMRSAFNIHKFIKCCNCAFS